MVAGQLRTGRGAAFAFVTVCAASHGLLDMFTNGAYGVALWWPLSADRLFLPWHPIEVSPLSIRGFASERGLAVLGSELLWVWLPAAVVCATLCLARRGDASLRTSSSLGLLVAAMILAAGAPANGETPARTEILQIDSVTLTDAEFLTGVTTGPAAKIGGELRGPRTNDRAPAVIMLHGSSGIRANAFRWADELLGLGVAVFVVDSFGGRGITNTGSDQSQLGTVAMTVDAYRALAVLGRHPRIDAERIAVMGFSKGGFGAVYSSLRRFQRAHGPVGLSFAAHLGFYPPCQRRLIGEEDVSDRPIRIFHGEADDWVPIAPCRDYVERLRRAGKDAALLAYPEAPHGFDSHLAPRSLWLPTVQRGPGCDLEERPGGLMVLGRSGEPFRFSHPCVQRGATIGYHPDAHRQAIADVKSFLRSALRLPP